MTPSGATSGTVEGGEIGAAPAVAVGRRREEEEIRLLLAPLVRDGAPPRRAPAQPAPCERSWLPAEGAIPGDFDRVIHRRFEAAHLMPDAEDSDYKRYRGSGGWGRRKRFNSFVAGDTMLAHSSLEYDYLRDGELDGTNLWFLEQPLKIRYRAGARTRLYTPDALVMRSSHVECVEVKFEHQAGKRDAEAKWHAVANCLLGMGIGFRVVTERHVRRQPRFANVKEVFVHRHARVDAARVAMISAHLASGGPTTASDLARQFDLQPGQVWALARRASVTLDLDAGPLGDATRVSARAPLLRPWS